MLKHIDIALCALIFAYGKLWQLEMISLRDDIASYDIIAHNDDIRKTADCGIFEYSFFLVILMERSDRENLAKRK